MFKQINQYFLVLVSVFVSIAVMTLVSSCATHSVAIQKVKLDHNIQYIVQPIPESLNNTGIQALFKLKQQGEVKEFLMQVEMTPKSILVSGMTIEGLSLFSLHWDQTLSTIKVDNKIAIEPMRILAEFQFVLWPVSNISKGLQLGDISLDQDGTRYIKSENTAVYQINQQENISHLKNLVQGYSIEITEIERWQVTP